MIEEILSIKSAKKELKEFGILVGGISLILGFLLLWKQRPAYPYFLGAGGVLLIFGLLLPGVLKPLQKVWMSIAVILGFFMSRIILFILFYLVITPMGLLTRIMGKDILDQKIDKSKKTYWKDIRGIVKTKESYENQY